MKLYVESELQHHGVKGMRWGHRKQTPSQGDGNPSTGAMKKERMKARYSERVALKRAAGSVTNQRKDAFLKKANEADTRAKELDAELAAAKQKREADRQEANIRADKAKAQGQHLNAFTMKAYANKGKTYATSMFAGALAGTTLTVVKNWKNSPIKNGKQAAMMLFKGAAKGIVVGAATAAVTTNVGKKRVQKSAKQDNKKKLWT